jgi:hypothetical protein
METSERNKITGELIQLIEKGNAHATFEDAVADLPPGLRTIIPEGLPYSIWQLTEHIRITQWDIVEFCLSPDHESPSWPKGYWTKAEDHVTDHAWNASLKQIKDDRQRFFRHLTDRDNDLLLPFPHGHGQNLLREAMLIADHTSYHTGEILVIRRLLKSWK